MEKGEKNMTIKTLEHIHYLLREDVETKMKKYKLEHGAQVEMEEDESTSRSALKTQEKFVEALMRGWTIAQNALEDFEAHDWA